MGEPPPCKELSLATEGLPQREEGMPRGSPALLPGFLWARPGGGLLSQAAFIALSFIDTRPGWINSLLACKSQLPSLPPCQAGSAALFLWVSRKVSPEESDAGEPLGERRPSACGFPACLIVLVLRAAMGREQRRNFSRGGSSHPQLRKRKGLERQSLKMNFSDWSFSNGRKVMQP